MTDLKITTVNEFDEHGVFPLRTIHTEDTTARTPAVANQPGKLQIKEEVHPDSRGVNELYLTVGGDDLDEAMQSSEGGEINRKFEKQAEKTEEDELSIAFTKYTETSTLGPGHAPYYVDLHATYSDLVTVPMMHKIIGNIDDGLKDPNYRTFKKNVVTFLNHARDRYPEKPIMGLIPKLGWEYIDDLMGVYEDFGIQAYAFDFERCKITTGTQLAMVRPLMVSIANRGIEEHVLFYAMNPSPGVRDEAIGGRPAADISSFGLGFDIVGGRHVSPPGNAEVFEQMESGGDEEPTFRLFDRKEWVYREVPVSELPSAFPSSSAFDGQRVADRVRRSPGNAKYKLQHLVNGEQKALAASDLRGDLEQGDAFSHVREKSGITEQAMSAFKSVRDSFDDARFQSGLGEF